MQVLFCHVPWLLSPDHKSEGPCVEAGAAAPADGAKAVEASDGADSSTGVGADSSTSITGAGIGTPASYPALVVLVGAGAALQLKQVHTAFSSPSSTQPAASGSGSVAGATRLALAEGAVLQHTLLQWGTGERCCLSILAFCLPCMSLLPTLTL